MKEVKILQIDNRGRIVIPQIVRKSLGLIENSQIMLIADSETKEIKITPLRFGRERKPIKFHIRMEDSPGSLAKIATTFGDLGISMMYGEAFVESDKTAVWTVIVPTPETISLEDVERNLYEKGEAIDVKIVSLE